MTVFQKLATAALVSVLFLIFVGAVVRVSGSGMGCPDWPTCWGCLIPPTSVDEVDFESLPIERFQAKAQRMGRDPSSITAESLRAEFNPRHVWTEFINRLCSLPVGFFSLATFIAAFGQRRKRPWVFVMAFTSLFIVLLNAWMGARVVYSGLQPGVLTAHLALAMALTGTLAYCAWRGTDTPWRVGVLCPVARKRIYWLVNALLILVVAEGVLGAQVREMTDELAKFHQGKLARSEWIGELESSWMYLAHRSFSWIILALTLCAWLYSRRNQDGTQGWVEHGVHAIVWIQMLLGVVMSQIHIYSWVQVLHVGLAAIMLTLIWLWRFGLSGHQVSPVRD